MWHCVSVVAVSVLLTSGATVPAKPPGGWAGQRVILRFDTPLKVGRQVVDDPHKTHSRSSGRATLCFYRVERVQGPWLWLVPEKRGVRGWAQAAQVVPYDRAIDYAASAIRARPKEGRAYLLRAGLWREKKQYDKGLLDFDEAIRLDPTNGEGYCGRAIIWAIKKEPDHVIADCAEALRLDHKCPDTYIARAHAWHSKGKSEQALADIDQAIQLGAREPTAYCMRALTRWETNKEYDRVIADCTEAINLGYQGPEMHKIRGAVRLEKGEYDRAVADFSEVLRRAPKDAMAYEGRGMAWMMMREFDKGMADVTEAIRLDPDFARAVPASSWYVIRASTRIRAGNPDGAIHDCDEAIRLEPRGADAHYCRGFAWLSKGDADRAIADATEAITLQPGFSGAYELRGHACQKKGDLDRAIAEYTMAITLNDEHAGTYAARGSAWRAKGEAAKAAADFLQAARLDPAYRRAADNDRSADDIWKQDTAEHLAAGQYELEKGIQSICAERGPRTAPRTKHDEDIIPTSGDEAVRTEHQPKTSLDFVVRGISRNEKGVYDQAVADFLEALRLDPDNAAAYLNRGISWKSVGEYTRAIADFDAAIRLDPENHRPYTHRGATWQSRGEYARALADYDEAVHLAPAGAEGYRLRAWLWATCPDAAHRDGKQAVASATRACELSEWKKADHLATLAAACAEAGDFDAAVKWQEQAQKLCEDAKDQEKGRGRLALYKERKPYHEEKRD